jgi:LCP family protein required for cell wall assembly
MQSRLRRRSYSPTLAAILSLIPGLGQAYVGRPVRGLIFATPWIALIAAASLVAVFDRHALLFAAASSAWLTNLTVVLIGLLLCHVVVVVDAFRLAGGTLRRLTKISGGARFAAPAMIAILLATTVFYGGAASLTYGGAHALSNIFGEAPVFISDNGTPPPSYSQLPNDNAIDTPPPTASGVAAPTGSATPFPTQAPVVYQLGNLPSFTGTAKDWAADGQLNVLLIGIDAGVGGQRYLGLRPDSMILLQVDIATGRAAMYGIPRDLINVPLPPESAKYYACHCYGLGPGQNLAFFGLAPTDYTIIDYLWREAAQVHPDWYSQYGTGNSNTAQFLRGLGALEGAVSELAGLQVDGAVVINLPGFVQLIDALAPNGLNINVPNEVKQNPNFGYEKADGSGDIYNIDIKAGPQVMNGVVALEYARLRHVIGYDSDYYRMQRQQLVLRAVRDQINPCSLLPQLPAILNALGGSVWTDLPESDAPTITALAAKIGTSNTANYSLDPATTGAPYDVLDQTSLNKIHSIVAHGLDSVPAGISSGGGGGGLSC